MPAREDHAQRRQQVAQVAADLIATGGLAAATHRRIAEAAGTSTTVVSHYFTGRRDLVLATYREVGRRVSDRLEAAAQEPDDRLTATLAALLPLDAERVRDWRLLFTFLGLAATDAELTNEQRERAGSTRTRIETELRGEQQAGRVPAHVDVTAASAHLLSIVLGTGTQALFDPRAWPAARMRTTLAAAVAEVRSG